MNVIRLLCFAFLLAVISLPAQDSTTHIVFDFNNHTYNEKHDLITGKPVNISLIEDRFGNPKSACYLHGNYNSYLNLGTSPLLKPKHGTIALWVKLDRRVFAGKGYESNPIIITKNSYSQDFYDAYTLFYDLKSGRFMTFSSIDSTGIKQAGINSVDTIIFNRWYHLAVTYDNHRMAFYVNGQLQAECDKDFETHFLAADSVMVGNGASKKNNRWMRGTVDDIEIFHRVLSPPEIQDLYHAPNPNRLRAIISEILKWLGIAALVFLSVFLLLWQRRRALKREKERYELEIRTIKAQMNPHFIFNSLNSIQQFIMLNENRKAELYLARFAKLMRNILESNVTESLTIKEEAELLHGYIEIEALRFDKKLNYNIEIDSKIDASNTRIPHLMIQPFAENAIWHGLLPKAGERNLLIRFEYIDEKTVRCVVEDNGVGRDASRHKEETFKKKSLALSFIKQRLNLFSKTLNLDCSVKIIDKINTDQSSAGTKILVILPILK